MRLSLCLRLTTALILAALPAGAQPPSFIAFESGPVRPLALTPNLKTLLAVNTPDNRLEIFDVRSGLLRRVGSVPVGLEPVAVAARTNKEIWVVNHLSDSVSIVNIGLDPPRVVRTLLVGDEPRDIVFALPVERFADGRMAGGRRAFITTAHRGQQRSHPSLQGVPGAGDPQLTAEGVPRADVWVFDAADLGDSAGGTPLAIVELFGDTPRALAVTPDGESVYAAVFMSGNQTTIVPERAVCDGFVPSDLDDACPGEFPGAPGGLPGPATNHEGAPAPEVGLLVRFDRRSGGWHDELGRDWSAAVRLRLPNIDVFEIDARELEVEQSFRHVGTINFNMVANHKNGHLYVSNTEAHNEIRFEGPGRFAGSSLQGLLHQSRITVIADGRVMPRHLNRHIDYSRRPAPPDMARHSLATPLDMVVSGDGKTLFVAAFGSAKVGVFDTDQVFHGSFDPRRASRRYIDVTGGGPGGLAIDNFRGRLYVATRFDNGISTIDLARGRELEHRRLHNPEPPAVVRGRPLLYDARLSSSNGESSCASCHVFGDLDGLAWNLGNPDGDVSESPMAFFSDSRISSFVPPINGSGNEREFHPMKGPMTTQTLRGMAHSGAMHWRGDRSNGIFGASALDAGLSFRNFSVAFKDLLGRAARLPQPDMRRFSNFMLSVVLPPNPVRALDNTLTPAESRGRADFIDPTRSFDSATGRSCVGCHTLDPGQGRFGTSGVASFLNQPQMMKIPHLRNLYQKVGMFGMAEISSIEPGDNDAQGRQVRGFGFLHDGSVDTLERFFNSSFFIGFNDDEERRDMEAFMLAFDTDLAPVVGQQVTRDHIDPGRFAERIDLFLASAGTPFTSRVLGGTVNECDLVIHGTVDGEARGALFDPATGTFTFDRQAEPARTLAEIAAIADVPGQALTFTCAPPGSGRRMALDRDLDSFFDRDEIDAGSNPADPSSVPQSR